MNLKYFSLSVGLALSVAGPFYMKAEENVPCLIFSGDSEHSENVDLKDYNRIEFDQDKFILSSSANDDIEEVILSYAEFNKFRYGIVTPTISDVELIIREDNPFLFYSPELKALRFVNPQKEKCTVCIMSADGKLVSTTTVNDDKDISVINLMPGIYIAFVYEKADMGAIKFIK